MVDYASDAENPKPFASLERLLDRGLDIDYVKKGTGHTMLVRAAGDANVELVTYLLGRGASVNQRQEIRLVGTEDYPYGFTLSSALGFAERSWEQAKENARYLPLTQERNERFERTIEILKAAGARKTKSELLWSAIMAGDSDGMDTVLDQIDDIGRKEIMIPFSLGLAANLGRNRVVRRLLHRSPIRQEWLDSALWSASWRPHFHTLRLLLSRGANINTGRKPGRTALMSASSQAKVRAVRFLLDCGSDVNDRDEHGQNALIHAIWSTSYNNTDKEIIIRLLLAAGSDVNVRHLLGETALQAAERFCLGVCEELRAAGATE